MNKFIVIAGLIQTVCVVYIVWLVRELRVEQAARWPELVKLLLDYEREVLNEARSAKTVGEQDVQGG